MMRVGLFGCGILFGAWCELGFMVLESLAYAGGFPEKKR